MNQCFFVIIIIIEIVNVICSKKLCKCNYLTNEFKMADTVIQGWHLCEPTNSYLKK